LTYKKYYFEKSGDQRPLKKRGEIRKAIRVGEFIIKKMIKLNEKYSINNGQGTIVFTEGKRETINAEYEIKGNKGKGIINGTLENEVLIGTFRVDAAAGLIEFTFSEDGFEAKWKQGIEPGPMRGKWEGSIGMDSYSELQEENTNKKVHYMTIYLDQDAEGNDLAGSENAADFIYNKIHTINTFIKDRIDNEVQGFLFEEFYHGFDSIDNRSINSPDMLEFIKNKLKTYSIKYSLESFDRIRASFIFDPKEDELEIWKSEFLELSELIGESFSVFGYHAEYEDIVTQAYDIGDYDTGIIACDLEVIGGLSLSSYMKSESENRFPQDSIYELSNYSL
jgi:hypothetical protein